MAAFDLTAANKILKEFYLGPVRNQMNLSSPLLAELSTNTEDFDGLEAYIPLHTARAENIGWRAEGGALPTARPQTYRAATIQAKYGYARIEITLPALKSTKGDRGSFLRALESQTKGTLSEMKEDMDRQLATNDASGRGTLANLTTTTASNTVNVATTEDKTTSRKIRVGMLVDLYDLTGDAVIATERRITTVTIGADGVVDSFVIDGAPVTTAAGDVVVRAGSYLNEMVGIPGIISDADDNLQGVDTGDNPIWASTVLSNSGTERPLTEELMQSGVDEVEINSGEPVKWIITSYEQRRNFGSLLQGMKRAVNKQKLAGGYTTLTFNDDIPLVVDKFIGTRKMYYAARNHLALYQLADWDWADMDGSVLSRVSGKPNFEAFLYKFCNLGTDQRNAHALIDDLDDGVA